MERSRLEWTKIDRIGSNWIEMDQTGPNAEP